MVESSKQQFLSYVVAIYSVGQFVGSLFFGFWSNRRRTIEPLLVSLFFLVVANFYYGFAQAFPVSEGFPRQWHVFIARFFVGFGAGNVAVARAFVSEGSTLESRNMAMTITGAAQGMGFVLGPAVGFALTLMPDYRLGPVAVNGYTTAGFVSALFSLINIVLIPIMFRDIAHKSNFLFVFSLFSKLHFRGTEAHGTERVMAPPMTRSEFVPMAVVMWIFFVILTSFSIFETITGPLTQDFFGWGDSKNGLLIFLAGVFSVVVFLALGIVTKKLKVFFFFFFDSFLL
jgi:MFS family permease